MVYNISSPDETEALGKQLGERLKELNIKRAFIALDGEMGVGKTVFCRGFASAFGVRAVKSPTYTIVNEYRGESGVRIFHFDLYRIDGYDDLESIGYSDYVGTDGYCVAEWSIRAEDEIPEGAIYVRIDRTPESDDGRTVEITGIPV